MMFPSKLEFLVLFTGFVLLNTNILQAREENGKRLIKTSAEEPAQWLDPQEVWELISNGQKFIDITNNPELGKYVPESVNVDAIPTEIRFNSTVRNVIQRIDQVRFMEKLDALSNGFFNRYYNGRWGEAAQLWWKFSTVEQVIKSYLGNAYVFEVTHPSFRQKSLVARLEGAHPTLKNEVVVLGAHFDSTSRDGPDTLAPGADDNGAGSVVILETLRVFAEAGLVPSRTVEFHWYAGEEAGLLGSQAIAAEYKAQGVNVVAMLNQDVIGYYVPGIDDIGLHVDNGNNQMIELVRLLTDEYLDFGQREMRCGYGCSDHASWTLNGFPAVMTTAVVSNPAHHRANDTIDAVDPRQTAEFVKLSVAFLVEMSEPQNVTASS